MIYDLAWVWTLTYFSPWRPLNNIDCLAITWHTHSECLKNISYRGVGKNWELESRKGWCGMMRRSFSSAKSTEPEWTWVAASGYFFLLDLSYVPAFFRFRLWPVPVLWLGSLASAASVSRKLCKAWQISESVGLSGCCWGESCQLSHKGPKHTKNLEG